MSLERKCLLFFGSALSVLMCGAFFVVQKLGKELVKNTTRQRAQDYGAAELMLIHSKAIREKGQQSPEVAARQETLQGIRADLQSESIEFTILGLADDMRFNNLPASTVPEAADELQRLQGLEPQFRTQLASTLGEEQTDIAQPVDLGENEAMTRIGLTSTPVFAEVGPINDRYIFYKPIFPKASCMICHGPVDSTISLNSAEQYPFRVVRVSMPYQDTEKTTTWISAIVIALAMLIVAVTLFVLHAIVRYLVLQPLYHLRDVSDAITHGDINQRATLDTEDEFRELADAFNRMLRHMTETQEQISDVNQELDGRVDQLAQLNLQLYEANRVKSDFLANMSHELRTPLNSIIGFSDVLRGIEALDDKQRRYAENIQKSGRLLLEMINDILDLAKVEAGKMEIRRSDVNLSRLISAQSDMIQSLSEDKNISLSIEVPDDLPTAHQDANKLGQILNNLLGNAIKFTPEGGMITVRATDLGDGRFRLLVKDTGVGIAEEDHGVIFQKFRQSRKVLDGEGLTREYAGTGLGLSIVKELAKLLGGEIDFESELGQGSSFWVTLPWQLSDRPKIDVLPVQSLTTLPLPHENS